MTAAILTAITGVAVALISVLGNYLSKKSASATVLEQLDIRDRLPKGSRARQNVEDLIAYRMLEWRSKAGPHRTLLHICVAMFGVGSLGLFIGQLTKDEHGRSSWNDATVAVFAVAFFNYILFQISDVVAYRDAAKVTPTVSVSDGPEPGERADDDAQPSPA